MIASSLESVLSKEEKENPATEIKDGKSFWNTLLNNGEWRVMEAKCQKALEEGKKVEIEIKIRYPSGSESKRLDKFIINSITTDKFGNRKLSKYEFYN